MGMFGEEKSSGVLVCKIDKEVADDLGKVRRAKGVTKKQVVMDAITRWLAGKLVLDDVRAKGDKEGMLRAKIGDLKDRFDKEVEKRGMVQYIVLSMILKKYMKDEYGDVERWLSKTGESRIEKELSDLPCSVLSKAQIRALLSTKPPLIKELINLNTQLQPNGVDLTVQHIEKIVSAGCVDFSNKDRKLSETERLDFNDDRVFLPPGPYKVLFNEVIHLPKDIMAIGAPRTSLIRCGVTIETGFWDAGYEGRSESLLIVANEKGFYVKKNARILQLVFIKLAKVASTGYKGIYQSENI